MSKEKSAVDNTWVADTVVGYDETRFFKHMAASNTKGCGTEEGNTTGKWADAIDSGSISSYSIMMGGPQKVWSLTQVFSTNLSKQLFLAFNQTEM